MAAAVTIALDRERELRLDFNCLTKFEVATGRSALDEMTWAAPRGSDISAFIWAAQAAAAEAPFLLAGQVPPADLDVLSLGQLRAMLDGSRIEEVQRVLAEAWGVFFPDRPDAPAAEAGAAAGPPPS